MPPKREHPAKGWAASFGRVSLQQVGQAAERATERVSQAAVEADGQATWTPKGTGGAKQGTGRRRRPASRRPGEGETKRSSKRGTRSRSSDKNGKSL
jgi:hypothetical protein